MGRTLTNDFSWSKSRHERFESCARAYYFQYYASWGGWERGASDEVRALWILKKLGNRFTWAGGVVHDCIKSALLDYRVGRAPDPEEVIARAHRRMQADYRFSASRAYWNEKRPGFAGLVEHEYGEPVPKDAWKTNWGVVEEALRHFFGSRWVPLAQSLAPDQWLEVDEGFQAAQLDLEGVKVFAIPDFVYREPDGTVVVVDWKTGRAREGYDAQVLGYALYVSTRYRVPVERVKAALVYLNEGTEQTVQVDEAALEGFRVHFRESVAKMRALLKKPEANVPKDAEAFARTEDLEVCAHCAFRRPCGREGVAAEAKVA